MVKVAKNRATEVKSPNVTKLSMFIIYGEKEEKLNDPQETQMDLSVVSPSSVGMTRGCEGESGMENSKADRC